MNFAGMKEKAVNFVFDKVRGLANERVDIARLQDKLNAKKERVGVIRITDLGKKLYFQVKNGKVRYINDPPEEPDGGVELTSDVLLSLARGTTTQIDPATGDERKVEYTPYDALFNGDLDLFGEAVSNDALLFGKAVYQEVAPDLQEEITRGLETHQGA